MKSDIPEHKGFLFSLWFSSLQANKGTSNGHWVESPEFSHLLLQEFQLPFSGELPEH
jgi:hypothetical protein